MQHYRALLTTASGAECVVAYNEENEAFDVPLDFICLNRDELESLQCHFNGQMLRPSLYMNGLTPTDFNCVEEMPKFPVAFELPD